MTWRRVSYGRYLVSIFLASMVGAFTAVEADRRWGDHDKGYVCAVRRRVVLAPGDRIMIVAGRCIPMRAGPDGRRSS